MKLFSSEKLKIVNLKLKQLTKELREQEKLKQLTIKSVTLTVIITLHQGRWNHKKLFICLRIFTFWEADINNTGKDV